MFEKQTINVRIGVAVLRSCKERTRNNSDVGVLFVFGQNVETFACRKSGGNFLPETVTTDVNTSNRFTASMRFFHQQLKERRTMTPRPMGSRNEMAANFDGSLCIRRHNLDKLWQVLAQKDL